MKDFIDRFVRHMLIQLIWKVAKVIVPIYLFFALLSPYVASLISKDSLPENTPDLTIYLIGVAVSLYLVLTALFIVYVINAVAKALMAKGVE